MARKDDAEKFSRNKKRRDIGLQFTMNRIATFLNCLLAIALIAAVVLNFSNVIARYCFGHAFTGIEDIQVYLMIGITFIGTLVAEIRQQHLSMDVLRRRIPGALRNLVELGEITLSIAVSGLMAWLSVVYTLNMWRIGSHSENAHIAIWIPHSILVFSFVLMMLAGLLRLVRVLAKRIRPAAAPVIP